MIVTAPMAGNIWKVLCQKGDEILEDDDVIIMESMKMEIPITVYRGGTVLDVFVKEGDFVNEGEKLLEIFP